jgi:tetratricopeptide (TPR) repeat protein
MELNPFVRPWGLVMTYDTTRQYDAALEDARLRLETYPQNAALLYNLSDVYRCKGLQKEAAQYLAESFAAYGLPEWAAKVRAAFARGGYPAVVRWQIAEHEERGKSGYSSPVEEAQLYALLGNRERALSLLEDGLAQRSPELVFIQSDPAYDFLHGDTRYRSVVRRVGLPESY